MHTVELLELAIEAAERLGYSIRRECLYVAGGACEIAGRKWIFLDLSLSSGEQLELVTEALSQDPDVHSLQLHRQLARQVRFRRAA